MAFLWSVEELNRFTQDGEKDFHEDWPCIVDRLSLEIISGEPIYQLPDYVVDIRRVTWMGFKVEPLTHRRFREVGVSITATSSRASDYIFDCIGRAQIRFFPIPNINIAAINSNLYGSEIPNRVIIEYYRVPDHVSQIIPHWVRQRVLKAYVMKMCFAIETKGQNLKASQYWDQKWQYMKDLYGGLICEYITMPRRVVNGGTSFEWPMPRTNLPYDKQGIGVDKGE